MNYKAAEERKRSSQKLETARARAPVTPDSELFARVHCVSGLKGYGEFSTVL